jgi:O-antigen ligase
MAFLVVNAVQLLWTLDLYRGLFFFAATAYLVGVAVILADSTRESMSWGEMRDSFLWAVYVNASVVVFLAVIFLLSTPDRLAALYYGERPKGFFKDPNVAGAFAVPGVLYAVSRLLFSRERKLASALGIISLGGVLFSFSRGALLGMVAGLMAVGVVALVARRTMRFTALFCVVTLMAILALPVAVTVFGQSSRFQGLTEYDVEGRFAAWQMGLRVFTEAPWGIGPGAFEKGIVSYFEEYSAHNTFLRVLVENGLVGVLLLALGLAGFFRLAIGSIISACRIADRSWLADSAWLTGSLTAVLAESWLIDTLHWRHFWVILGFVFAYHRILKIVANSGNL